MSAFENLTKEKMEQQVVNKQMEEKLQAASKGKDCKGTEQVTRYNSLHYVPYVLLDDI